MRTICWHVFISMGAAMGATSAQAADAAPDREVSLTIYNKNIALIEHVRPISAPAGRQRIEFTGVSAQIVPETVSFIAPNVVLVEQNFDYDLLTPAKLMEKAVGSQVRVVRVNPATGAETTETAEVLSTVGGVVLRIGTRIEVLREDNLPTRVIFDKVPENLRAQPTLSVLVNAAKPVNEVARLTYLSRGFTWSAEYVALFDETRGTTSMQGWITLRNTSGTSFTNARTQLIAGDVNLVDSEEQWWTRWQQRRSTSQRSAGTESTGRQQLGDYYVYPIRQLTTVANNQTKQVSFIDAENVKASKGYELSFYGFQSNTEPQSAEIRMRIENSKAAGMGEQLPSGVVRIYMRDARGQPQFVGEDLISHTSAASELALKIGDAFDVTVQPTLLETRRITKRKSEFDMSYLVRSARGTPSVVTLRQFGLWRQNEMLKESIVGRRTDANSFAWDVPVPANGETTLTFTVATSW
ncbi:MAG TPA: DUF4139 domain-containing protein [Steroidobacteraceae bacterium]|nr:DUF4139 domain-containing protein [Steroidobacteraceae bacterium]